MRGTLTLWYVSWGFRARSLDVYNPLWTRPPLPLHHHYHHLNHPQMIEMPDEPGGMKEVIQEGEWAEGVYVPPAEPIKPGSAKKKKKK